MAKNERSGDVGLRSSPISLGLRAAAAALAAALLFALHAAPSSAAPFPRPPFALNDNATTDTGFDDNPSVAGDGAGTWVAVWSSTDTLGGTIGTDVDILFSRSTDDGASWSTPAPIASNAGSDSGIDIVPTVSTNGVGLWMVAWQSNDTLGGTIGSDYDILYVQSGDGGVSWSAPTALNGNAATDTGSDKVPRMQYVNGTSWLCVWQSNDSLGGTIGTDDDILRSLLNLRFSSTWAVPVAVNSNAATDTGNDVNPAVDSDGLGGIVLVWQSTDTLGGTIGADEDILTAHSTNSGVGWSAVSAVASNAATDSGSDRLARVASDGNGTWMVVWASDDTLGGTIGSDWDILVSSSTDVGVSWTAVAPLGTDATGDSGTDTVPDVASDGSGTWLAVWESNEPSGGLGSDFDVLLATSIGTSWSGSVPGPLANNATTDSGSDAFPVIEADDLGHWLMVWSSADTLGGTIGTDSDVLGVTYTGPDSDGDGLTDAAELHVYGTDPSLADTDADGLSDWDEVMVYGTDPLLADTDGDLGFDPDEITIGTDPFDSASRLVTFGATSVRRGASYASDGVGTWVAVWSSTDTLGGTIGSDADILFSRSTDDGVTWSVAAALGPHPASDSGDDLQPRIASDGASGWVVVWSSTDSLGTTIGTDSDILAARSSDGGASWSAPVPIVLSASSDTGVSDSSPDIATDGAGRWIIVWETSGWLGGGPDSEIDSVYSIDGGASWSSDSHVNVGWVTDNAGDYGPRIATDGAGVWGVAWESSASLGGTIGADQDILFASSVDGGATWSASVPVNSDAATDDGSHADVEPSISTDRSGRWLVTWTASGIIVPGTYGTDSDVFVSRSIDAGASWSALAPLTPNATTDSYEDTSPVIATDGAGAWLVLFNSNDPLGGAAGSDYDILLTRSADAGTTWTLPRELDPLVSAGSTAKPGLVSDRRGRWIGWWTTFSSDSRTLGWGRDVDGDGLADAAELSIYGTDPALIDSDGDGLSDGDEVNTWASNPLVVDTDGDGLGDGDEVNTYGTDPILFDSDLDGFSDGVEIAAGTDPLDSTSHPATPVPMLDPLARGLLVLAMGLGLAASRWVPRKAQRS